PILISAVMMASRTRGADSRSRAVANEATYFGSGAMPRAARQRTSMSGLSRSATGDRSGAPVGKGLSRLTRGIDGYRFHDEARYLLDGGDLVSASGFDQLARHAPYNSAVFRLCDGVAAGCFQSRHGLGPVIAHPRQHDAEQTLGVVTVH